MTEYHKIDSLFKHDPATKHKTLLLGDYVAGPRLPDFKAQHPRVYAEIEADAAKWMPSIHLASSRPV
jgi:hypothetical protein